MAPAAGATRRRERGPRGDAARCAPPARAIGSDYDALLERVGDARLVLLGEASHGTHEFYRERARITKRLIEELGLHGRGGRGRLARCRPRQPLRAGAGDDGDAEEALRGFRRFPTWMWRNAEVLDFVGWLRAHNEQLAGSRTRRRLLRP